MYIYIYIITSHGSYRSCQSHRQIIGHFSLLARRRQLCHLWPPLTESGAARRGTARRSFYCRDGVDGVLGATVTRDVTSLGLRENSCGWSIWSMATYEISHRVEVKDGPATGRQRIFQSVLLGFPWWLSKVTASLTSTLLHHLSDPNPAGSSPCRFQKLHRLVASAFVHLARISCTDTAGWQFDLLDFLLILAVLQSVSPEPTLSSPQSAGWCFDV